MLPYATIFFLYTFNFDGVFLCALPYYPLLQIFFSLPNLRNYALLLISCVIWGDRVLCLSRVCPTLPKKKLFFFFFL